MADQMTGLFGPSPYEVQQARNQQMDKYAMDLSNMNANQLANYGFAKAGQGLAGIGAGMMGMVDPAVEQAKRTEQIMGQGNEDMSSSAGWFAKAKKMLEAGDQRTAAMWLLKANQLKKQEDAESHANKKDDLAERRFKEAELAKIADKKQEVADKREMEWKIAKAKLEQDEREGKRDDETRKMIARMENSWKMAAAEARSAAATAKVHSQIVTDESGMAKLYNLNTGDLIKDLGSVGKPSATYEKTQQAEKATVRGLDEAMLNIDQLLGTKEKPGLLYQATGSGIGAIVDMGANLVGKATTGAIANAKIQPLSDAILKMVPRFEGPQSDKDTASYKSAAGDLANPNLPIALKIEAAKIIRDIFTRRKGQFVSKEFENETLKPTATTVGGLPSQDLIAAEIARRRGGK